MNSLNVASDYDGNFCLEAWNKDLKITIWVNKDGTFDCFTSKDRDVQEMSSPYEALKWFGGL